MNCVHFSILVYDPWRTLDMIREENNAQSKAAVLGKCPDGLTNDPGLTIYHGRQVPMGNPSTLLIILGMQKTWNTHSRTGFTFIPLHLTFPKHLCCRKYIKHLEANYCQEVCMYLLSPQWPDSQLCGRLWNSHWKDVCLSYEEAACCVFLCRGNEIYKEDRSSHTTSYLEAEPILIATFFNPDPVWVSFGVLLAQYPVCPGSAS